MKTAHGLKTAQRASERYGVIFLLWWGVLLKGGRTPPFFLAWSLGAFLVIALRWDMLTKHLSLKDYKMEAALALCLMGSQAFSQDSTVSLYYTSQALVFFIVWVAFKGDPKALPPISLLLKHLMALGLVAVAFTLWQVAKGRWHMAFGLFPFNPIFNASWIACIAAGLAAYALRQDLTPPLSSDTKRAGVVALLLIATCLILPARSSVLALLLGLAYAGHRHFSTRRVLYTLILGMGLLAVIPSRVFYKRLRLNEGNYRNQIWGVGMKAAQDHPLVGRGLGNFEMAYQRHAFPVETDTVRYGRTTSFAHNEFLQVASDIGLPGFFVLLMGLLMVLRAPTGTDPDRRQPAKAMLIVLCVLAAYNIVWHLPLFIYVTLLCSRLILGPYPAQPPLSRRAQTFMSAGMLLGMTTLVLILGAFAVRDRWSQEGRWEDILHWNTGDATAWKMWAVQQKEVDLSLKGYAQAVRWAPEQPYFHEAYALALEASRRQENYPRAIDHYLLALRYAPNRPQNARAIGRILFLFKKPAEALPWFKKALQIEPNFWECDLWIARCLAALEKPRAALAVLKNLQSRREVYLNWRTHAEPDLPSRNDPSNYETSILNYNDAMVRTEIALLQMERKGKVKRYNPAL